MHPDPNVTKSWEEMVDYIISKAEKRPLFFKDMSYHVIHHADIEFLKNFTNTFLIRDPKPTLLSHYKMNPDFTYEEAGYEALYKLFKMTEEIQKKPPVVVDALDLEENPYNIIKKYCEQVNIPFIPEALHWKQGEIEAWSVWKEWHLDAMKSDGFIKNMETFDFDLDINPKLEEFYQKVKPYYREMYKYRIK